ncbi:MAG: hypothetical protein K6T94_06470 [Paenibacillus sp.]|nr:hypothetical protein [Paenibacillus sp.]
MLGKRRVQFLYLVSLLFVAGGIINLMNSHLGMGIFSVCIGIVFGIRGLTTVHK